MALAELRGIQSAINKQFPDNAHGIDLEPLSQYFFGDLHSILYILLAAVGFILLIACVNLANMLLARAASRAREFAVRRALGASPARMLQQALTECLLLSGFGALVGLALAAILTRIPIAAWPKHFVQPSSVHLDGTVLTFTTLLALGTAVFFGLIPALRILGQAETSALQQGRTATDSRGQHRTRSILVVSEIALSMLLVAGSLNMAFYFVHLMRTDLGVNPQNVLSMTVWLSPAKYSDGRSRWLFDNRLLEKLAALPGVTHAAATQDPPFWRSFPRGKFSYDGQPNGPVDQNPVAGFHYVTPGYFATVQAPILQGRDFSPQDRPDSPMVAIVNRGMAEKLWLGQSAIGKRIHCCGKDGDFVVIGVVADVRLEGPAQPAGYEMYISVKQRPTQGLAFLLRTRGDPLALVKSARHAVRSIDPAQAISDVSTLEELDDETLAGERTSTIVAAILGTLALLLASVGVYGVMAYTVSRREREFGIRIALGSSRSGIVKDLFSQLFRLVAVGIILGAGLVCAMRLWIASLLGANGMSILVLLASTLLICVVATLAIFIPARHASRTNPMQALRIE
jgi:putative ABC transport system permease protein